LWGSELRELMLDYDHYAGWGIVGECLPSDANTVTLDPEERDADGLPVARVTFAWGENDRALQADGVTRSREIADAAGAEVTWMADDTAHLMGACRMGSDRATSVVDRWCRSWDVPNLFVCDGSVFVTSGAVNPSLTIQAIAARTARYIAARATAGSPRDWSRDDAG
ncbi:MAG: GMC family oxidoreductase, partial [Chloroflexi bacterium]|nr:GMC family oxidoreductase [Chloroflexota bacterium]